MYNFNDENAAVMALQNMLYEISKCDDSLPTVFTDGIYGDTTAECVRKIQARNSLQTTGTVDYETFNCIKSEWCRQKRDEAKNVGILPDILKDGVLKEGDESTTVVMLQSMLHELSYIYEECENLNLNGIIDAQTLTAVKKIQKVHGLEPNGEVDIQTWNSIVIEYEKFRNCD